MMALCCGLARAETQDRAAEAGRHYETGMAHFQLEEWDQAVEEWEAGFRLKPAPEFLYNIAQAYRLSKRPEKALSFYRKYLNMNPKAANRLEVERHLKALQKIVDEQSRTATSPPTQPLETRKSLPTPPTPPPVVEPPVAPAPAPAPVAQPAPAPEPQAASIAATTVEKAPEKKPITKKGWFWGVVGGAVVLVAGAVVVGVLLGGGDSTKTLPAVRF